MGVASAPMVMMRSIRHPNHLCATRNIHIQMSTSRSDSVSSLLEKLFAKYGQGERSESLMRLSNRCIRSFSDSMIRTHIADGIDN